MDDVNRRVRTRIKIDTFLHRCPSLHFSAIPRDTDFNVARFARDAKSAFEDARSDRAYRRTKCEASRRVASTRKSDRIPTFLDVQTDRRVYHEQISHSPTFLAESIQTGKYQTGHRYLVAGERRRLQLPGSRPGLRNVARVSRPKAITRSAYLAGSYSGHVRCGASDEKRFPPRSIRPKRGEGCVGGRGGVGGEKGSGMVARPSPPGYIPMLRQMGS